MSPRLPYSWQKLGVAGILVGAGIALYLYRSQPAAGPADTFNGLLVTLLSGWIGAVAGMLLDWARRRRSPFEPLFKKRFRWYYAKRYWLRLAIVFSAGWAAFVAVAVGMAYAVGAEDEAAAFLTVKGAGLVVMFLFVFAFEGAVIGGLADIAEHLLRKHDKKHEEKNG